MPLVANWPSAISPGQTTSQLVDASDFLPTFADLEGLQLPKNEPMDGLSFARSVLEKTGREREWCFFWYAPGRAGTKIDFRAASSDWTTNTNSSLKGDFSKSTTSASSKKN